MAIKNTNERFNNQFAEDVAEMRLRMQLMLDAINALDTAMRGTFELLIDQGMLPPEAAGIKQYTKMMDQLRKLGLKAERVQVKVQSQCPNCKTNLRIAGNPGERCEWCGYEF
ncbi:MAG: hypothetical protein JST54_22265 [Deltaproteobacteria bacterium]|nr:hypothetical protein [Deltaproteobacteria bacterium]